MEIKGISRRSALRMTVLGGLMAGALTGLAASTAVAAEADAQHPAVGVWENLAPRLDIPEQSFFNQFSFLPGGVAVFASPPVDSEPGDDSEYTGPFFGVWEAEGPNAIAFSVRHATYSATVSVTGFEEMWGTGTISADGNSMEVNRTFAEAKTDGDEEYRHSRPATFTRQQLRRNP
jgi:hypothetical protein